MKQYYVYILECSDGTFYTGQTKDIKNRLTLHATGKGAKYVRGRTPFNLRYIETFTSRSGAMTRELSIKKYPKTKKNKLFYSEINELESTDTDFLEQLWKLQETSGQ